MPRSSKERFDPGSAAKTAAGGFCLLLLVGIAGGLIVSVVRGVVLAATEPGWILEMLRRAGVGAACGAGLAVLGMFWQRTDTYERTVNLRTGETTPWRFVRSTFEGPFGEFLGFAIFGAILGFLTAVWRSDSGSASSSFQAMDLPRIGTVGDAPARAGCAIVEFRESREAFLDGERVDLDGLREGLGRHARVAPGGPVRGVSDRAVLIRMDRRMPWILAAATLHACAKAGIQRVFLAVRHEEEGSEGALAVWLPVDDGPGAAESPEEEPGGAGHHVIIAPAPGTVDPRAVFAAWRRVAGERGAGRMDLSADGRVPMQVVLQVCDAILRASPPAEVGFQFRPEPTHADFQLALRQSPPAGESWAAAIDGSLLALPDEGLPDLPRVARVERAFAGWTQRSGPGEPRQGR